MSMDSDDNLPYILGGAISGTGKILDQLPAEKLKCLPPEQRDKLEDAVSFLATSVSMRASVLYHPNSELDRKTLANQDELIDLLATAQRELCEALVVSGIEPGEKSAKAAVLRFTQEIMNDFHTTLGIGHGR